MKIRILAVLLLPWTSNKLLVEIETSKLVNPVNHENQFKYNITNIY